MLRNLTFQKFLLFLFLCSSYSAFSIGHQIDPDTAIQVSSVTGVNVISVDGNTLQMEVSTVPVIDEDTYTTSWSITLLSGDASIDTDGLLTPISNGNVSVVATVTFNNGIVKQGAVNVAISNQLPLFSFLNIIDSSLAMCEDELELTYTGDIKATFDGLVDITLANVPNGLSVTLNPEVFSTSQAASIDFENTGLQVGEYEILVIASVGGTPVDTLEIDLRKFAVTPSGLSLNMPQTGQINVPQNPMLSWFINSNASSYDVQISTAMNFANIVFEESTEEDSLLVSTSLDLGETHYWRVRGVNPCGNGVWSTVRNFIVAPDSGALGCTDTNAINFDPLAVILDNTCVYPTEGCTDNTAVNYNPFATVEDSSCTYNGIAILVTQNTEQNYTFNVASNIGVVGSYNWDFGNGTAGQGIPITRNFPVDGIYTVSVQVYSNSQGVNYNASVDIDVSAFGCTDPYSINFSTTALFDDGSCIARVFGCTNELSPNYDSDANIDDGSCIEPVLGCTDPAAFNFNPLANFNDGSCIPVMFGCTDSLAFNFDSQANTDDGSCIAVVEGCTDSSASNFNPQANVDDGTCEDPILGCIDTLANNFMFYANTDDGSCLYNTPQGEEWEVEMTSDNHTVLIPGSFDQENLATSFENGDYIGAFYENTDGDLQCAGRVLWEESTLTLAVYGAETDETNGFTDGEEFRWIHWKLDDNTETEITVTYDTQYPQMGMYTDDGISGWVAAESGAQFSLNLATGWNFISSNLLPVHSEMDSVFGILGSDLLLVKDENGDVFWPSVGINAIGNYEVGEAYKVNVTSDVTLDFFGQNILPENYDIALPMGWSYIGYLRKNDAAANAVFSTIEDEIFIVKDAQGNVFWPQFNINTIGNLSAGNGYQIRMNTDTTFRFPSNATQLPQLKLSQVVEETQFTADHISDHHMHIALPSWAYFKSFEQERVEVVAFQNATCLGSTIWKRGEHAVLTLFGGEDDLQELRFEILHGATQEKVMLYVGSEAIETYAKDDALVASRMERLLKKESMFELEYATESVNLHYDLDAKVTKIEVYDALGKRVLLRETENTSSYQLNKHAFSAGIYTVVATSQSGRKESKKVLF